MKLYINYILAFYMLFLHFNSFSQCAINGNVLDSLGASLPFTQIGLLLQKDSAIYKGAITNQDGKYCFENIKKGDYFIKITAPGFNVFYSKKIEYDSLKPISLESFTLNSRGINLSEVSVTTQKQIVEFKNGNITVNIDGTALAAGNSAYDLLVRLPGVSVNESDISINGKSGVKIMIDNKLQQLSGSQLINVLKSINASQIDKIEVLKKPPVKYDAAGTGGMINIKTKKLKLVGFSGNLFGNYSQGFYGNPEGGFTLNYKGKKFNFFSGVTAIKQLIHKDLKELRIVNYDTLTTTINQHYIETEHNNVATYNLGADWFINKNNSIGVKVSGAAGLESDNRESITTISDNSLGYKNLLYDFKKPNPWIYPEFNLNAEHLFDTTGTTLRLSVDYNPYYDLYEANFNNRFLDDNLNQTIAPSIFKSANILYFSILSSKLDFEKQFNNGLKVETGVKHAYQNMLSDFKFENFNNANNQYEINTLFTNVFSYKENISAAYLNLNKEYKKFFFQLGARGENTIINAESKTSTINYTRQYFNVFPMLSVEFKKSEKHNFQLSANKRINRPDYNSFNPFKQFRSVLFYNEGNPYLLPEYSNSADFTYSYKAIMYHTISFSRTDNVFIGYNSQNDSSKVSLSSTTNLKKADYLSYNLYFQKELKKWWLLNISINVYSIEATGTLNNLPYKISTIGFNPYIFSRVILPKKYTVEFNAFYLAPVLEGIINVKSRSSLSVGLKKEFLDDKLSFSIAVTDLFFKNNFNSSVNYQNINSTGKFTYDTRRLNININYNFGKLKVKQREVKSNEEEKNRAGH